MGYTEKEQYVLDVFKKQDFRHVSKNDIVGYVSMLQEVRPEVASEIVKQYPQIVTQISCMLKENQKSIDKVIDNNNKSLDNFYALCADVQADLSKCLDKDISAEEREKILEREMEIVRMANKKDTESRDDNWKLLSLGSFVTILAIGVGAVALSGKFNIKLPKKQ